MSDRDDYDARFDYKYPTSSKTSPNRKFPPEGYDGVEYIPSGRSPSGQVRQSRTDGRQQGHTRQTGSAAGRSAGSGGKRKVKPQSQSAIFMALIVGFGVLICFGAFFLMFSLTRPSNPVKVSQTDNVAEAEELQGNAEPVEAEMVLSDQTLTGAVKAISNGTITVVNFSDDSVTDIYVNADTTLRDKYGQAMTISQFSQGDIVLAEYDSLNNKAQLFRIDPEGWTKSSVKNIEINADSVSVKAGNETLSLSKNLVFLPDGTAASVKASDVVTLKGYKTKIMTVLVEKRSGTIEFKNKDRILDGTVEVDSDIYKALEETGSLKVPTGEHTIVVKGANIDVFIKEITVSEGETVVIDLEEAQVKEGIINLSVNEPDYILSVNDEIVVRSQEPMKRPFGTYKLRVSKEGFTSWEGTVTVNQPSVDVNVTLTAEAKTGNISVAITNPPGLQGSVYIDNALIGTTPINKASVAYGTHQLTIKAPGYIDTSTPIVVEGDATYNVTMHPSASDTDTGAANSAGNTADTVDVNNAGGTEAADPLTQQ